jgi:cholesterol transport system auxiliary component
MTEAFADANLVYKTGKVEWQSDYYNLFFVSPQSMITDIVRDALAQSGIFSQVMTNRSLMAPTHFLESAVTDLYGDYSNKKAPAAVVKMEFLLLDDTGGTPSIVMKKNYKSRIALSEASPEELVAGFGKGMTEILTQLQRDIHDILKGKN